jgi:hypothetical protein
VQNIGIVGAEKKLCKVGSEDVDRCPQRNLKNRPYSPDVAPPDYHLFGTLKESFHETRFENVMLSLWLLNNGSDELVLSFIMLAYWPKFQGGVRQLKGMEIMWRSDILFLKDVSTYYMSSKGLE